MLLAALFALNLGATDTVPTPGADTGPAPRIAAPAIAVHRQPSVPIVSLRLSILANDPPGYAGVGHMIQHLLLASVEDQVSRVGGRVQIERTADAMVYTVTGPALELPYLARVLIGTLSLPQPATAEFLQAERELREERLAEWETAQGHTRSTLRSQLFPADISAAGTDRSVARFSVSTLAPVWAQMYRPERVSVLAVGDVYLADVQREFAELPAARGGTLAIQRDSVVLGALAPAQATSVWLGAAYLATGEDPAAVSVAARLLGDVIRRRVPAARVDSEHWWTHHGQAVAIVASMPPGDLAAGRRILGTAVASLMENVSFLMVSEAATAIRREMLFYSRAPDRMAELLGMFVDRGGDPNAAERYYAELDSLDDEDVREVLESFLERTPARVEIQPQVLQTRPR